MSNKNQKQELKNLSAQDLGGKIDEMRRELFSLRLHAATQPVKDHTKYKKLRRQIACALTYLGQKAGLSSDNIDRK